ncbi:hypothetical protein MGG_11928 [Pyricularia oryzae 70-15]|uniref:Uncharacterized protein n=1 Tax=Pyricularia oryzae (strain 70-15 / ATCC MYA-4617 / FGSC 8958) TaxID=242507 RepID=G4MR09_PYRO7|nr:uncharacterized protein MGG_11928 [Pyricularia oryzae 70-15]EHA56544.1 hypothetical protein MGG_11928 [Pyricularia oryzae 70-15]
MFASAWTLCGHGTTSPTQPTSKAVSLLAVSRALLKQPGPRHPPATSSIGPAKVTSRHGILGMAE